MEVWYHSISHAFTVKETCRIYKSTSVTIRYCTRKLCRKDCHFHDSWKRTIHHHTIISIVSVTF